jgi:hypothetical protein
MSATTSRRDVMRVTLAATCFAVAALVAGPALADANLGGPVKQSGQCWAGAKTWDGGTYGYWKACPDEASNQAIGKHKPRHQ